jgi:hypothetical protein
MANKQVNIRLPAEDVAVLEAAGFLEGEYFSEIVRRILMEQVAALRRRPVIQQALRLRAEHAAAQAGVLTPLEPRRRRQGSGDGDPA